jgi:hypothetical protein
MKKIYPDWVEKQHVKGTSIKQIRDNYYLYSVTSHYSKEKGYPVSEQRYIGKITPDGLIEPEKITFIPGIDKLILLRDVVDLGAVKKADCELLGSIPVLVIGKNVYTGRLNRKQTAALKSNFNYENGVIRL